MTKADWQAWLTEWSRELIERFNPAEYSAFVDSAAASAAASGWLGAPGATEEQLAALEARLGRALPPSYRTFLEASNGFFTPGLIVPRVLPVQEVAWFRETNAETIDAFNVGLTYGGGEPESFLQNPLQISAVELVGTAVYLLNPNVVGPDGEWEAGYFADWVPGVDRYSSFLTLMEMERSKGFDE